MLGDPLLVVETMEIGCHATDDVQHVYRGKAAGSSIMDG